MLSLGSFRRAFRRQFFMAALAGLFFVAACTRPSDTAVPEQLALRQTGNPSAEQPLASVIRQHHIRPLEPLRGGLLIEQAYHEIGKSDPAGQFRGVTYSFSRGNALGDGWLIETPGGWGRPAAELPIAASRCPDCVPEFNLLACTGDRDCRGGTSCQPMAAIGRLSPHPGPRVCVGQADVLIDHIYNLVSQAQRSVDILALYPVPDGRFLASLRSAIASLARSGRSVSVRVILGVYPTAEADPRVILQRLATDPPLPPSSQLSFQVASMRSCSGDADCGAWSWSHAKMIAVDGNSALVGGHNLWTQDYLVERPVGDISMEVRGPAAADAQHFADALWAYVCSGRGRAAGNVSASLAPGESVPGAACSPAKAEFARSAPGRVPILAVGRLATGITEEFANQSDLARDLMLGAARKTIRIVQQDVAFTLGPPPVLWPESSLERLAQFLLKGGEVYMVLSNFGAAGNSGSSYSTGVALESVAQKLHEIARAHADGMPDAAVDEMLCRHLHVASYRFGPDATWPNGKPFGWHGKFWMVDERAFYIGSDNFYPVDLQEFGYIVEDRRAAGEVLRQFWQPLWQWSQATEVKCPSVPPRG